MSSVTCPAVVCTKIEKIDYLLNYMGVNLRVTSNGVVVSFPSGYGVTIEQKNHDNEFEEQVIFNSFNSVVAQYDANKRVLKVLKTPMLFAELKNEIKKSIRQTVQKMNQEKGSSANSGNFVPLTKEMIETSNVFTSK